MLKLDGFIVTRTVFFTLEKDTTTSNPVRNHILWLPVEMFQVGLTVAPVFTRLLGTLNNRDALHVRYTCSGAFLCRRQ